MKLDGDGHVGGATMSGGAATSPAVVVVPKMRELMVPLVANDHDIVRGSGVIVS